MRKLFIALFILTTALTNAQTIDDIFKTMPKDILPGITDGNRTMLLVDTGKTTIPYELGTVEKLTDKEDYLKVKTSAIGTTEIKLLPIKGGKKIICVTKTVCGKACDSNITFYSYAWEKLDQKTFLPEISKNSFMDSSKKDSETYKYAVSLPDICPISAEFINGGTDLQLTLHYKDYLSERQQQEIKPFIKTDVIVLKWNNEFFK